MPRIYQRKFDWDEAKKLRAEGTSYARIGAALGVSSTAVQRVCNEKTRERLAKTLRAWMQQGECIDCGTQTWRSERCVECSAKARATTARESELECVTCHEWKPDAAFPLNRANAIGRRGRHTQCRPCQTTDRRAYRERHKLPCSNCGGPRLADNETRAASGLCLSCYRQRAQQRSPQEVAA